MAILTRSELRRVRQIEKMIGQPLKQKDLPDGMEICEIQLYHLATKIRDTDINPEVEGFLPAISDVLEGLTREELIQKIVSVEFSRFHDFYSKNAISSPALNQKGKESFNSGKGTTRYFINLGEKDGLDWMSLKDMLKATLDLGKDDVYQVDVMDTFSFFNTDSAITPLVLETFQALEFNGRRVHVEISSKPGGGKGGGKGSGKGGGKRRKKGYKASGTGSHKSRKFSGGKKGGKGKKSAKARKGFY